MAYCTECGFKLPAGAVFCPNCGHRLSAPKAAEEAVPVESDTDVVTGNNNEDSPSPPPFENQYTGYYNPVRNEQSAGNFAGQSLGYDKNGNDSSSKTAIIVIASVMLLLIVAVVLLFQYATEKRHDQPAETPSQTEPVQPTHSPPTANRNPIAGSGYVQNDSFYISFIGAEQFTDIDNEPAIRIYYEFTNLTDFPRSAWDSLGWMIKQDGIDLEYAYSWEDVEVYYYDTLSVRPGLTIQCCIQYKYRPGGGTINLTMFGWDSGESGGKVSGTYVPGNLPGSPRPYEFKVYSEPQWTTKLDAEGNFDDNSYHAAVIDAELIDDYYGDLAIRVYYEFTNNTSQPASLYDALYQFTYQDGISLFPSYAETDSETDKNLYVKISEGGTITASAVFRLRNDTSNVEAELESSNSFDAIGQTYQLTP